jgi:hypothetical protein
MTDWAVPPRKGEQEDRVRVLVEDIDWLTTMQKLDLDELAARLHCCTETIARCLRAAGRGDLLARVNANRRVLPGQRDRGDR